MEELSDNVLSLPFPNSESNVVHVGIHAQPSLLPNSNFILEFWRIICQEIAPACCFLSFRSKDQVRSHESGRLMGRAGMPNP